MTQLKVVYTEYIALGIELVNRIFRPVKCCIIKVSKWVSGSQTPPAQVEVTKPHVTQSHQQSLTWLHRGSIMRISSPLALTLVFITTEPTMGEK